MAKYASNTAVSVEKSRAEIETILSRYGASTFAYMQNSTQAVIMFEASGRRIKFVLPLPDRNAKEFTHGRRGNSVILHLRSPEAAHSAWEQACRQKWRALALAIKAKLEAVDSKIATFEEEFLAYVVLPDGQTVGQYVRPQLQESYEKNTMPLLLPGIGGTGN
jgi:hypothetical protein